jgi:hypothetical protein
MRVNARSHDLERLDKTGPTPIEERVPVGNVDPSVTSYGSGDRLDQATFRHRSLDREATRFDEHDVGRKLGELGPTRRSGQAPRPERRPQSHRRAR